MYQHQRRQFQNTPFDGYEFEAFVACASLQFDQHLFWWLNVQFLKVPTIRSQSSAAVTVAVDCIIQFETRIRFPSNTTESDFQILLIQNFVSYITSLTQVSFITSRALKSSRTSGFVKSKKSDMDIKEVYILVYIQQLHTRYATIFIA